MAPRGKGKGGGRPRVMAQIAMVMNLDKCIGCHTCSVTCKQTWTNRPGTEYVWFNNVETRPGQGYPRRHEDQDKWKGGWELKNGRLVPRAGGRVRRLTRIFSNPELPALDDYYQPWTYDYDLLTSAPLGDDVPTAPPRSTVDGRPMEITWGPNWDDDLGGGPGHVAGDPLLDKISEQIKLEYEQSFMFYLPRICEHCLNPSCVAACPSGALYKRIEDGIVLVDQDRCRGWRMCVSACPYKKIYFNHQTGNAEKCTLCYPRIEAGEPTICSETCVGRLRYLGVMLYDPEKVGAAASVRDERDLYPAQLECFLDPNDPEVAAAAEASGIPYDWIESARRSPVYDLITKYKVALPLHPEYRTLPMVWYVPPLSPIVEAVSESGHDGEDAGNLFGAIDALRIPVSYLAELFTAGDPVPVAASLRRLAAMRDHMRRKNLGDPMDPSIATRVGLNVGKLEAMYRLLALAKYDERYVIPTSYVAGAGGHDHGGQGGHDGCSLDGPGGPGMTGPDFADSFHAPPVSPAAPMSPAGAAAEGAACGSGCGTGCGTGCGSGCGTGCGCGSGGAADGHGERDRDRLRGRVNLLNWDGRGRPSGLFPTRTEPQT